MYNTALAIATVATLVVGGGDDIPPSTLQLEHPNKLYAIEQAWEFGVDPQEILRTVTCESNWHIAAVGDSGAAYSYAQFHRETFEWMRGESGMTDLEYDSGRDQLRLMAWGFSQGYQNHWVCWTKLFAS